MTFNFRRFSTVLKREFTRYWNIKRQTLLTPLLNTYLYIGIFGAALGSRVGDLEGFSYIVFILPGLVMMALAMGAFENNSSSLFQMRFMRAIDDQLASPLSSLELLAAYTLGGLIRGSIVAGITLVTASFLIDLPLADPVLFFGGLLSVGLFFALLGVLAGVLADQFDQISLYTSFILQPLIFLGGVFYSVSLLPEVFQTISHFNPLFYMINLVRHGMLGASDVDPWLSLGLVLLGCVVMFLVNYRIFQTGYRLRS
ncbi:MAG TPA: ABC transporter permease [Patescibacteria group bacterium]